VLHTVVTELGRDHCQRTDADRTIVAARSAAPLVDSFVRPGALHRSDDMSGHDQGLVLPTSEQRAGRPTCLPF
jgi:hypothetical protein